MKHLHICLLLFVLLIADPCAFAQEGPVSADTTVVPGDSVSVDSISSDTSHTVIADSLVAMADSLVIPRDSLHLSPSEWDSVRTALLHPYQATIDSLLRINQRISLTAYRRLRTDMFIDSFRNHVFHACIVNPQKVSIKLYNRFGKRGIHSFNSLSMLAKKEGKDLIFAMNAGMYERNRRAKGLLITEGHMQQKLDTLHQGYGNFYMQPNGVFALDSLGKAYVLTTQAYASMADTCNIMLATQSGPMLLVKGQINPKFNDGSPNLHIRNAVGVTPANEVVFAISRKPVTFFELSSFMKQQGCTDALYLDGAISQAYLPSLDIGSLEAGSHLGPIFILME